MSKRLILGVFVATIGAVGLNLFSESAETQSRPLCTMPNGGTYSPGALERNGTEIYACVYVYGEKLSRAGVAWVKVTDDEKLARPMRP